MQVDVPTRFIGCHCINSKGKIKWIPKGVESIVIKTNLTHKSLRISENVANGSLRVSLSWRLEQYGQ